MEMSNRISVLYWNEDLYKARLFKSNGYILEHHHITLQYDFHAKTSRPFIPDGLSNNIIMVTESHKMLDEILDEIYRKVSQPNIVYFVHSVEKNIFDGEDNDKEWDLVQQYSKRINKMYSFHFRHPIFKYDPTLWMDSFRKDIPDFFSWFDRKGLPFLSTSNPRFGIHIHRISFSKERLILIDEISKKVFNYPTYITCRTDDITNQGHSLDYNTMKYYEYIKNKVFLEDFSHSNKERWWEENYRIWCSSLIEVVIETFNSTPLSIGFDEKFTEKTLRPILGCKPLLFLDPFSYRLFRDMGFCTYDSLMGDNIKNLYDNWDRPKGDYSYVKHFVNRLQELANMDEGAFERVYEDALMVSMKNREILDSWKFYYEDCERYFDLPPIEVPKPTEKPILNLTPQPPQIIQQIRELTKREMRRR